MASMPIFNVRLEPATGDSNCVTPSAAMLGEHQTSVLSISLSYPCPLKNELKCNTAFRSRLLLACYVTDFYKINYTKAFGRPYTSNKGFFECPRKEEFNCSKTFVHRSTAWKHVHKEHCLQPGRLPCPLEEELGCQNTFACVDSARNHAKRVHASTGKELQFPCPRREDQGCQRSFNTEMGVVRHIALSHRVPIPCLLKDN